MTGRDQPTRRAFLVAAATVPAAAVLLPAGQQRPEPPYWPGDIRPEPQQVELSYVTAGKVFTADQMNQVIRSIKQLQQREGRYRRA